MGLLFFCRCLAEGGLVTGDEVVQLLGGTSARKGEFHAGVHALAEKAEPAGSAYHQDSGLHGKAALQRECDLVDVYRLRRGE